MSLRINLIPIESMEPIENENVVFFIPGVPTGLAGTNRYINTSYFHSFV